jgi:type III restriction enzyme
MLIVDKEKECETNDVFKAKKMPVAKWKDYAKTSTATIDVIIFKMVGSCGVCD